MKTLSSELQHLLRTGQLVSTEEQTMESGSWSRKLPTPARGYAVDCETHTLCRVETWEAAVKLWHSFAAQYEYLIIRPYEVTQQSMDEDIARARKNRLWNFGVGAF